MKRLLPLVISLLTIATLLVLFLLLAAPPELEGTGEDRLLVAVSVAPQAYLVNRIGGSRVQVTTMIPPGNSPHSYEPTPHQVLRLTQAELYVKVGHPVFPFERSHLERIFVDYPQIVILDTSELIQILPHDPHLWVSPAEVRIQAQQIAAQLAILRPQLQPEFEANLQSLLADIDELAEQLEVTLGQLENRHFMVFHPSWGYFAREFGLVQVPIEHHHASLNPAELGATIERARENGVSVIFVQPGFDTRQAQVIADQIGARVEIIDPLDPDWLVNLRQVGYAFAAALE